MTNKKNKNILGWLPKDPVLPQKTYNKSTLPTPSNHAFAKIGGSVLSVIGIFLVSVYSFEGLFYDYSHFTLSIRWLFYAVYALGIGIAITGLTLRQRFASKSDMVVRKTTFLIGGLALLSIAVIGGLISTELITQFAMTHGAPQYYGVSFWDHPFSAAISFCLVGFAGWMILLRERNWAECSSTLKAAFSILSAGILLLFANALTQALLLTSQSVRSSVVVAQLVSFSNFIGVPAGTLLLTCGWIFLLANSLKLKTKTGEGVYL